MLAEVFKSTDARLCEPAAGTATTRRPLWHFFFLFFFGPISQYKYYISQRRCGRKWERMSGFMFRARPNLADWLRSLRPGVALVFVAVRSKKKK